MASKRRELRIIGDDEFWETLEAMQNECGFTCASGAVKNLVKVHGAAEVARARLMKQGIYPTAAPIAAGIMASLPQASFYPPIDSKPAEVTTSTLTPPRPQATASTTGEAAISAILQRKAG